MLRFSQFSTPFRQEMQDASLRATTVTFSSAINACAKAAAWQRALHLGIDMARQNVSRLPRDSVCALLVSWYFELGSVASWQEYHCLQCHDDQLCNELPA